jgi:hypothetical protein
LAPSSVWVETGSPPLPRLPWFFSWKLPAASVKPIGGAWRWSCQLLTKKKTWVAFCARFVRQEYGLLGFHEHGQGLLQNFLANFRWNGLSG